MSQPRLIVALDVPTAVAARALVERLGTACDFYKVGSELFTAAGPALVEELRHAGKKVFLDLKLHDIPNTVRGACRSAAGLGVQLLTVHASGGRAMLDAAVEGAGGGVGVLAVTILTSLDAPALSEAWNRQAVDVGAEVLRLSDVARGAGVHGIVCAGPEVESVRERHGDALAILVPGVRPAGSSRDDQSRTITPAQAATRGAKYVVVGRAITRAPDPSEALRRVTREFDEALTQGTERHAEPDDSESPGEGSRRH